MRKFLVSKLVSLMLLGTAWAQMAPSRQTEIKTALRRHGYTGEMTAALKQVAKDNRWQTKSVPDSRVLILLGLGPKYPHLLNNGTAWIATPKTVVAMK